MIHSFNSNTPLYQCLGIYFQYTYNTGNENVHYNATVGLP